MKIGQILRTLASGATLYLVMAACGASDRAASSSSTDGGGVDGAGTADGSEIIDAFVDELESPVGDALAGPLPPDVATEACDKTVDYGGTMYRAAAHDYPGESVNDLSAVRMVVHYIAPTVYPTLNGQTFENIVTTSWVRAGSVMFLCSPQASAANVDSVTFIHPH